MPIQFAMVDTKYCNGWSRYIATVNHLTIALIHLYNITNMHQEN